MKCVDNSTSAKIFKKVLKEIPYYQDEQTWKLDSGQSVPIPNVTKN